MRYAFAHRTVDVLPCTLAVFWALIPHRVVDVSAPGVMTALYLPLSSLMGRQRHRRLLDALLRGEVLAATRASPEDEPWLSRLHQEHRADPDLWTEQHLAEIDVRLGRFALEGWKSITLVPPAGSPADLPLRAILQVERILSEIADRFTERVRVCDLAAAASLSEGHAAEIFRLVTGRTIKQQVTQLRIAHAQMLLLETDLKIAAIANDSGFGSLSSFYSAFQDLAGVSPNVFRRRGGRPG